MDCKKIDRVKYLKKENTQNYFKNKRKSETRKLFWIADFDEAVETYSRAFAISGHSYHKAKAGLMECKKIDRVKYLKKENTQRYFKNKRKSETRKLFWIADFDPRLLHQRKIIRQFSKQARRTVAESLI